MRHVNLAALFAAGTLITGCGESAGPTQSNPARPPVQFVKKSSKIVIDGTMGKGEWGGAQVLNFMTSAQEGMIPAALHVSIDATNLYLAVRLQRPLDTTDFFVAFQFDKDNDDVPFEYGDDAIWVSGGAGDTTFVDAFRTGTSLTHDVLLGGTTDGFGAIGGDNTATVIEIRHPLAGSDTFDIAVSGLAPEVGFNFDIRMGFAGDSALSPGEHTSTNVPSPGHHCKLDLGPPLSVGSCPSGRIATVRITANVGDTFILPLALSVGGLQQLGLTTFDYLGTNVTAVTSCAWGSFSPGIATVSASGVVTGVSPGTTIIHNACQTTTPVSLFGSEGQLRVDVTP